MSSYSHENTQDVYDLVGVGIGPFNLGLAALVKPVKQIKSLFIEQSTEFQWHPGLLLNAAALQVPFLADLVTLIDPTNEFSFLNYLKHHNRLYKFYFYENFFILRQEYNHYCQWIAKQLDNLIFATRVTDISLTRQINEELYKINIYNINTNETNSIYARHIALGIGTLPYIPSHIKKPKSNYIKHSANFLEYEKELQTVDSICIVGSGQSAGEIVLELLQQQQRFPRKLIWLTKAKGFFPMEYSKLGLEHFSPDYMNHFYSLNSKMRKQTIDQQDLMYKGISKQTIAEIFDLLYQLTIANQKQPLTMIAHSKLDSIEQSQHAKTRFSLSLTNWQANSEFKINCDAVILATGYKMGHLDLLKSLENQFIKDSHQPYTLGADFSIKFNSEINNKIYMQNNSLFSHGVGSADLGLCCYRNAVIINSILKREFYPLPAKNVFQDFDFCSENNKCK